MRISWVFLHRWLGLFTAAFLIVMGVSGALLSWGYELDGMLNPDLYRASTADGPFMTGPQLAAIVEGDDPRAIVTSMPLVFQKGHAAIIEARAKGGPTVGLQSGLGYNQVFVDPTTGRIMGKRNSGDVGLDHRRFVPLVYYMHYTLAISQGYWWYARRLSALVGLAWIINCVIGFYVTLPKKAKPRAVVQVSDPKVTAMPTVAARKPSASFWKRWKPAWKITWSKGPYRATFDMHRAFALWVFALLFLQALSATSTMHVVQRNLILPVLALFSSEQTPGPFVGVYADLSLRGPFGLESRKRSPAQHPVKGGPTVTFPEAVAFASAEAARRGWSEPAGRILYTSNVGGDYTGNASVYRVRFFEPGADNRFTPNISSNRIKEIYIDGVNGAVVGDRVPWHGTTADVVMQQIFPFHSSLVYGWWGRVVASILGAGTAMLSITGVIIWFKKRQSRVKFKAAATRASRRENETIEPARDRLVGTG